jgi:hypothetical protein
VTYNYRPKDPRAKLREVVLKYVESMRTAGRAPNLGVVFDGGAAPAVQAQAYGYLVEDRRSGRRYILMEDGDVLCDDRQGAGRDAGAELSPERSYMFLASAEGVPNPPDNPWMGEPDDELVTLLARSLADARMGGTGWMVGAVEDVEPRAVPDRRVAQQSHQGPERRR